MKWLIKLITNKGSQRTIQLARTRGFTQEVVGEASYQKNIEKIAGEKKEFSISYECWAILMCETNNRHDPNAVAVQIDTKLVGYLSRDDAKSYRDELNKIDSSLPNALVASKIIGGWKNEEGEGHFGVKLNLKRPVQLVTPKKKK